MLWETDLEFYKKNNQNFVTPFAVIIQFFWSNTNVNVGNTVEKVEKTAEG